MINETLIEISGAVPRFEHLQFSKPINWKMKKGQHWAIIGANGCGKTLLTDILIGKYALKAGEVICRNADGMNLSVSTFVKSVAFRDIYSIVDTQNSYYQQRWNKGDEYETPIVKDLVKTARQTWLRTLVEWFDISELMEKEVNMLSSGELRKFLIVRSLLSNPRILILDNPFIGLDAASRIMLNDVLKRLSELEDLQLVLVLSNPSDIPDIITNILPISNKELHPSCTREEFLNNKSL